VAQRRANRKKEKKKRQKEEEAAEEEKKRKKNMKNKFDYDALDKLAAYERAELMENGALPQDPDYLVEPDEDVLLDDASGHVAAALSYKSVKAAQWFAHVWDREKSVGGERRPVDWYTADISYIPCFKKSIRKSEWVTPVAKEIGLGPTLFLMTMKAFFWMFVLFTFASLPLTLLYFGQGYLEEDPTAAEGAKSFTLNDFFGQFSVGNLGVSGHTCANINVGRNEKVLTFACQHGTMREFFEYGLQRIDNQSCRVGADTYIGEGNTVDDLQMDCNLDNGMTEYGRKMLCESFQDSCYD